MNHLRLVFLRALSISVAANVSIVVAQTVDEALWVPNGPVYAVARSGNTVYIGGSFTFVGPPTGGGAAIDVNTGNANLAFPRVNGAVFAVAPDGSGGWYIAGDFSKVDGVPRNNLAQINVDGTLNLESKR